MPSRVRTRPLPLIRRLHAAVLTGLVVALTVFAAAPRLHQWLHDADHDHGGDRCAVVLFATGVTLAPGVVTVPVPATRTGAVVAVRDDAANWANPRYLLLPGRAPPAC